MAMRIGLGKMWRNTSKTTAMRIGLGKKKCGEILRRPMHQVPIEGGEAG
eukprot:CAMPEP_0184481206 /NCGR_PEP_ID=MMETSP0113_2-20130426/2745_1 /TAXON_ID=91329 /ORGANISM="Norrisiella sphaerica, Strain BC52" /LENGTH=48 /DNA_ID= /DNA_START= /DNA_END= /DNA_ORIENTATION=